jgi:hypothetical protein
LLADASSGKLLFAHMRLSTRFSLGSIVSPGESRPE